jgi:arylsulfatase A-like enzyme
MKAHSSTLRTLVLVAALVLAAGLLAARDISSRRSAQRAAPRGNVVLIVCDTLRADHLGLYGYPLPTSPFLDQLGKRGWVYERAYSHFSYTWPTIANLFTGIPFSELVARELFVAPPRALESGGLTGAARTLAESLAARGVQTGAVSANPYVNSRLGFAQGFGSFHDIYSWDPEYWSTSLPKFTVGEVNAAALEQLSHLQGGSKPWFLYLHYFDPHMPYRAPPEDRRLFEDTSYARQGRVVNGYLRRPDGDFLNHLTPDVDRWLDASDLRNLIAQYDAEIHRLDRGLRELFASLEQRGALENTTVIITADHGEAFMERGFWGHGFLSRAEEERVPLLVLAPRREPARPERLSAVATTTDLYFSILDHFGVPVDEGRSNRWWGTHVLRGTARSRVAITEGVQAFVVRTRRWSLYRYREFKHADGDYLFDLETDPDERVNLLTEAEGHAQLAQRLLRLAGAEDQAALPVLPDPLRAGDEEARRRLRALGYL